MLLGGQDIPPLHLGAVGLRPIRLRDWRALQLALNSNRSWLQRWEATSPSGEGPLDMKSSIRSMQQAMSAGEGLPYVIEMDDALVGQLNVAQITYGSLASCAIGYWVVESVAGHDVTPSAVALATDFLWSRGVHRVEICIRPENLASQRVVEKLGFRYEGLRRRYIHINGDWRDHFTYALVAEDVPGGVVRRWLSGRVDEEVARVPDADRARAASTDLS